MKKLLVGAVIALVMNFFCPTKVYASNILVTGEPMYFPMISAEEQEKMQKIKQWRDLENARRITYPIKIYPYGQCTYLVSSKRNIPSHWGNAGAWYWNAIRDLYFEVGQEPIVGAILVSWESKLGHVSLVTGVDENTFTIEEMNYKGWGIHSHRTVNKTSPIIKGFIY